MGKKKNMVTYGEVLRKLKLQRCEGNMVSDDDDCEKLCLDLREVTGQNLCIIMGSILHLFQRKILNLHDQTMEMERFMENSNNKNRTLRYSYQTPITEFRSLNNLGTEQERFFSSISNIRDRNNLPS